MSELPFEVVWQKVAGLEGAVFAGPRGTEFSYRFEKTYLVVSAGQQSIARTYFEKVYRRWRQSAVEGQPSLPGQSYILAILKDDRLGLC